MKSKKKEFTPMEKLTQGYDELIKEKKLNTVSKKAFDKILKKTVTTRPRGSK